MHVFFSKDWSQDEQLAYETNSKITQAIRNAAKQSDKKAMHRMVVKNAKKRPPSEYSIGDEVLVKSTPVRKIGKKSVSAVAGKVVDVDLDNFKYKICLNSKEPAKWFEVNNITSMLRSEEIKRQRLAKLSGSPVVYFWSLLIQTSVMRVHLYVKGVWLS